MLRSTTSCVFVTMMIMLAAGRSLAGDLPQLLETRIPCTHDAQQQPIRYWAPEGARDQTTPVLLLLHTWSGDYTQDHSPWQQQAVERGWIYVQPNFRGRNDHPEACGSPAARQDILDALDWAIDRYQVDAKRIYLAGVSGGGHMSLLMAGYHPQRFSAVSAWVGISDLAEWYRFHSPDGEPQEYARMLAASCGGPPGESDEIDREYHNRSPIHYLQHALDLPLDICAGVKDGKTGSVPIHHSLRAYNVIAKAGGKETISQATMDELWQQGRLTSPQPGDEADDPSFGRKIHLRRHAGEARVTIFEGGHEGLPAAACGWLAQQSRTTRANAPATRRHP